MIENNSGRKCADSELPEAAKKACWGGFWLPLIWGLSNGIWISLIALFLPAIGTSIMALIFLFNGRKLAWENKRWDSAESFDHDQKVWGVVGLIINLIILSPLIFIGIIFLISLMSGSTSGY